MNLIHHLFSIIAFFHAIITAIANNGGQALIDTVKRGVASAEAAGGASDSKLTAAKTMIVGELQAAGLPVVMNVINAAIEAEVANLKAA